MNMMITLSSEQLRQAADLKERIDALQNELAQLLAGEVPAPIAPETVQAAANGQAKKRKMSPQARANIRAAQKARRAIERGEALPEETAVAAEAGQPKKKRSAAWSRRLSAAMKASWAARKAAGK